MSSGISLIFSRMHTLVLSTLLEGMVRDSIEKLGNLLRRCLDA